MGLKIRKNPKTRLWEAPFTASYTPPKFQVDLSAYPPFARVDTRGLEKAIYRHYFLLRRIFRG